MTLCWALFLSLLFATMSEHIQFSTLKEYLSTGVGDDFNRENTDLNFLQALLQRRLAHQQDQELRQQYRMEHPDVDAPHFFPESAPTRQRSRELLQQSTEVLDFSIIENIMTADQIDYDQVTAFLQSLNLSELPILSSTPKELQDRLKNQGFKLTLIPDDQINFTHFQNVISESEMPAWFHQQKRKKEKAAQGEYVEIAKALKERWFVMVIVLLGILSTIGFISNWAVELPDILGSFDWYLSFYGAVAVSRATWQLKRAESWNARARNEVRSPYAEALAELAHSSGHTSPEMQKLLRKTVKLAEQSTSWDEFQRKLGLVRHPSDKRTMKPGTTLLEQFSAEQGAEFDQQNLVNDVAETIINREFAGQPPTVAIVVPTYQTTPDEMSRLLRSIKDQAYPVTTAYVVYNDNPNDPQKPNKQAEFSVFQQIVNEVNQEVGRNNCHIKLLAQPARGKREAMAMGFAHALGQQYYQDLITKYPEVATEEGGLEQINQAIANVDLDSLPDFRHDYVLNIDSDTEIYDPMAVLNSALLMKNHPDAATTTGDVRVVNRNFNLLSEMTYQRYWRAFFVERAAQSQDGHVTCMSGPWVFMRSDALAQVLDEWYFQEFLGQRTTYGDDRNLSTLFLKYGWQSLFCPDSAVLTDCPTEWKVFLKQQLRWNKSFNRENFILFSFIHQLDKFTQFDVAYQQVFPFAMLLILINIFARSVGVSIEEGALEGVNSIVPYALAILFYNELFFGAYGAIKNKDPKFLMSPVYIGYHFRSLLWLKLVAFFKMTDTSWGTKGEGMNAGIFEKAAELFEQNQDNLIGQVIEEVMPEVLEATDTDQDTYTHEGGETL